MKNPLFCLQWLWSIRFITFFVFFALLIYSFLALWLPVYSATQSSLNSSVVNTKFYIFQFIQQYLTTATNTPVQVLDILWRQINWNNTLLQDTVLTTRLIRDVVLPLPTITATFIGLTSGAVFGYSSQQNASIIYNFSQGRLQMFAFDEKTGTYNSSLLRVSSPYNSTRQSWYIAANNQRSSAMWADVSVSVTVPPSLFISLGRSVLSKTDSSLIAVVGVTANWTIWKTFYS
jgi:hypothetical protein